MQVPRLHGGDSKTGATSGFQWPAAASAFASSSLARSTFLDDFVIGLNGRAGSVLNSRRMSVLYAVTERNLHEPDTFNQLTLRLAHNLEQFFATGHELSYSIEDLRHVAGESQ